MQKLILELRRREVFRTAGLYVGVCWIAIEVASVLLPTFDAPEWILRAMVIAALIGFPIALVLAWVYDFTEKGVVVHDDATAPAADPIFTRKTDFVVIGVLSVALMLSLYFNFSGIEEELGEPDPVSLLIADFDNQTGNPLFDGTLEQALAIGVEGASFVSAYDRRNALQQARDLALGEVLDEETARLVAVRQDVGMVLAGRIEPNGGRFDIDVRALDPVTGDVVASAAETAGDSTEVLAAMNELTVEIRRRLGEDSQTLAQNSTEETLTATSLEAIKHYTVAQELSLNGQNEAAIESYALAVAEDPAFARAYSGWGLSARRVGRAAEAEEKWQEALALLDRMTERERFRTLGLYYSMVSLNFGQAIDNYQQLVDKYPADGAGRNNLAVLYTMTAQYDRALAQSGELLELYPNQTFYHANHAHYAMYAGDFDVLRDESAYVLEKNPDYFKAYMFLAVADLYDGDVESAAGQYRRMAEVGAAGQSLSTIGLADIALSEGDAAAAIELLTEGIYADLESNNARGAAAKQVALLHAYAVANDAVGIGNVLAELAGTTEDGQLVPMSETFAARGDYESAYAISQEFRRQFRPTARAYADLIDGINAYYQDEFVTSIDSLQSALGHADLWLVRYYLALAYLEAGYSAEATAEFDACIERRGEAGNLFFDDVPTWRYTARLNNLRERAAEGLIPIIGAEMPELPDLP